MDWRRFNPPRFYFRSSRLHFLVLCLAVVSGSCWKVSMAGRATRICYHCVWLVPDPDYHIPSAMNRKDHCRPENFDPRYVDRETCDYDCLTMILYDYIDNGRLKDPQYSQYPTGFLESRNSSSFHPTNPNRTAVVTVFFRGCSRDPLLKPYPMCEEHSSSEEEEMHVFQQKCYCPTQLCNGEIRRRLTSTAANFPVVLLSELAILSLLLINLF